MTSKLDRAVQKALKEYSRSTVEHFNASELMKQTKEVVELLEKFPSAKGRFDFEKILSAVMDEPNNFYPNGTLKSGCVVVASRKAINKIVMRIK